MIFAILALVVLVGVLTGGRVRRDEAERRARVEANVAAVRDRVEVPSWR